MARLYHKLSDFDDKMGKILNGWKFSHKGIFSKSYLIWMLHDWLTSNSWGSKSDAEFGETYYEQIDQATGSNIQIRWSVKKGKWPDPDFAAEMDIVIKMDSVQDTEVMVDGKKVKAQSGKVEVEVSPRMIYTGAGKWPDYMKKFKIAGKNLEQYWYKSMNKSKVKSVKSKIKDDVTNLQGVLKSYFQVSPGSDVDFEAMYKLKTG